MQNSASKTFHFDHQSDYAQMVLLDSWLHLTALIEASKSILEAGGLDPSGVEASISRGDRAIVAIMRRDRTDERAS